MIKVLTVTDPQVSLSRVHHVGATQLPFDLCKELSKFPDIQMDLLIYSDTPDREGIESINIVDFGPPRARYQQQVYRKLVDLIDDYDIVHLHISTPGFSKYLTMLSKGQQKKIIYTMHTWTNSLAVSYYYKEYFLKLVTDSEVNLVFLTNAQKDALLKSVGQEEFYHPERVHIIYNAVKVVDYDVDRSDRAIAVGRMVESKGIDKIVRACIETNTKLLLVSPPWRETPKEKEYCDRVLDLINSAPEGLINLCRGMPHDLLLEKIKSSKFSIIFSTFDVFSLFVLESVSMEVPVLAYDYGSTSEVCKILGDCGVKGFSSYKDLVDKISKNEIPVADKSKIPDDCKYDKFVSNYHDLYETVTSSSASD